MRLRPGPGALWFVRHGQSEGNVLRDAAEAQGLDRVELPAPDRDMPLSELGVRQARAFGRWLAGRPLPERPTAILGSPYLRTLQTAEQLRAAAAELDVRLPETETDERLRDREAGVWDGLTWRGIVATDPHEAERALRAGRYYHRPPGGESWADLVLRLRSLFADLVAGWAAERVLLVTHDVPIQLARGVLEGSSEADVVRLVAGTRYENCALSAFEADDDRYRMTAYNEVVPGGPRHPGRGDAGQRLNRP